MSPKDLIHLASDDGLTIPPAERGEAPLAQDDIAPSDDVQTQTPPASQEAACLALMGAAGGVGVTSLAVEIAYNLARETQKKTAKNNRVLEPLVCLIDLDFENGACAHHLDLPPSLAMKDLQGAPSRIDKAFTTALMSTHESGLALLAAPNTLGGNDMVNPQTVVTLLDMACKMYDFVVLDVPRFWRPWTMAAIGGADHFALVTDTAIPSLHLARARLDAIKTALGEDVNCDVILNKYERRSFRNTLRIKDAETALKRPILASICLDVDTAREAVNCGEPAGAVRPDSRFSKDVRALQTQWLGERLSAAKTAAEPLKTSAA